MADLWQKWVALSNRVSRLLTFFCGILCLIGAWELYQWEGPMYIVILFGAVGALLVVLTVFTRTENS